LPINTSDENSDAPPSDTDTDTDTDTDVNRIRHLFTYAGRIIVPDRGTVTFTIAVDSSSHGYPFTVHDADNNLLGDGVIVGLGFDIESFHINQQPDTPAKPEPEQPASQ
jgi:hypothetical protein